MDPDVIIVLCFVRLKEISAHNASTNLDHLEEDFVSEACAKTKKISPHVSSKIRKKILGCFRDRLPRCFHDRGHDSEV